MQKSADIIICGAGIAGVSAAYCLAVNYGVRDIILIDERPPLTLTSNKGTQAYRNWWPGPGATMVQFINRSIDLLEQLAEQHDNPFRMNQRGYAFLSANKTCFEKMRETTCEISALGAGPIREHPGPTPYQASLAEGLAQTQTGIDLINDADLIHNLFPFLRSDIRYMAHVRRAGWLDAIALGQWLLQEALQQGVRLVQDRVVGFKRSKAQIQGVQLASGHTLQAEHTVLAVGPKLAETAALLDLELPVFCELHAKLTLPDVDNLVPWDTPMLLWQDPVNLAWNDSERHDLAVHKTTQWMLQEFPPGVHFRPRSTKAENPVSHDLMALWTYDNERQKPIWPPHFEPHYGEIVIRGLADMIPSLQAYFGRGNTALVDGGYYCKTPENRPLIGPLPLSGVYVIGALSGYGVMASQAAAELLALYITAQALPDYAPYFRLERYQDPAYQSLLDSWDPSSGQM